MVSEGIKPGVTAARTRLDGYNKKQHVSEAGDAISVFHDHTIKPAKTSAYEMRKAFNELYLRVFSRKGCLNPKLSFDVETLQRKLFIGLLSRMLKKEMLVHAESLREHAFTPNRPASF